MENTLDLNFFYTCQSKFGHLCKVSFQLYHEGLLFLYFQQFQNFSQQFQTIQQPVRQALFVLFLMHILEFLYRCVDFSNRCLPRIVSNIHIQCRTHYSYRESHFLYLLVLRFIIQSRQLQTKNYYINIMSVQH